ncbi:MAG: hypothetical protein GF405_06385 [Candidatus Eisenbacteria bacterium]|nr:hypothetical protein [Candidatus Eisenbacteria bacterium]
MRHSFLVATALAALALAWSAAPSDATEDYARYPTEAGPNGKLTLTVHPGEEWVHTFRVMLLVPVENRPQMAFWLEKPDGEFMTTIYVTRRGALLDWRASPGEDADAIERKSAIPVWSHRHTRVGIAPMRSCAFCHGEHDAEEPATGLPPDAVTSATPETGFVREWAVPEKLEPGTYLVRAEINHSKDFNETYSEDLSEDDPNYSGGSMGSGQPSLIWSGEIVIGDAGGKTVLEPVGHGDPAGRNGTIDADLSDLTTAREIVERIEVVFDPPTE